MKLTITTTDTTLEEMLASLQIVGEAGIDPVALENLGHWLTAVEITSVDPITVSHFRYSRVDL